MQTPRLFLFLTIFLISLSLHAHNLSISGFIPHYRIYWNHSAENRLERPLFSPSLEENPYPFQLQESERQSFPHESFRYWSSRIDTLLLHYSGDWNSWDEFLSSINMKEMDWFFDKTAANKMQSGISLSGSALFFGDLGENPDFLNHLELWINEAELNEINIDWEYPRTEEDFESLILLINTIHNRFPDLKVSLCISRFAPLNDEAMKAADQLYLMAYDYYGNHSTYQNAKEFVDYLQLNRSILPLQMVLGIPFYGRNFSLFEQDLWNDALSYRQLLSEQDADPEINTAGNYFYNGRALIQEKIEMAEKNQLGGIMIWELLHDSGIPEKSLLEAFPEKE